MDVDDLKVSKDSQECQDRDVAGEDGSEGLEYETEQESQDRQVNEGGKGAVEEVPAFSKSLRELDEPATVLKIMLSSLETNQEVCPERSN